MQDGYQDAGSIRPGMAIIGAGLATAGAGVVISVLALFGGGRVHQALLGSSLGILGGTMSGLGVAIE